MIRFRGEPAVGLLSHHAKRNRPSFDRRACACRELNQVVSFGERGEVHINDRDGAIVLVLFGHGRTERQWLTT